MTGARSEKIAQEVIRPQVQRLAELQGAELAAKIARMCGFW